MASTLGDDQCTALQEETSNLESQGREVSKFKKQRLEKLEKEMGEALGSESASESEIASESESESGM